MMMTTLAEMNGTNEKKNDYETFNGDRRIEERNEASQHFLIHLFTYLETYLDDTLRTTQ